jgi:hypothetical protein
LIYPPLYEQLYDYTGDTTNILLLGGPVLYFAGRQAALREAFGEDARVYNFAQTAHSSLDSLTKYRYALDRTSWIRAISRRKRKWRLWMS